MEQSLDNQFFFHLTKQVVPPKWCFLHGRTVPDYLRVNWKKNDIYICFMEIPLSTLLADQSLIFSSRKLEWAEKYPVGDPIFRGTRPGKRSHGELENHHVQWENPLFLWIIWNIWIIYTVLYQRIIYITIFNSYVKLPEGKPCWPFNHDFSPCWMVNLGQIWAVPTGCARQNVADMRRISVSRCLGVTRHRQHPPLDAELVQIQVKIKVNWSFSESLDTAVEKKICHFCQLLIFDEMSGAFGAPFFCGRCA